MTIVIIDYGSGNLRSVEKSVARAAQMSGAPVEVLVTADAERIRRAERVVLPGVGAFADCMAGLAAAPGAIEALEERILRQGAPFLGICVGMQLMAATGREHGEHAGLNWIEGAVERLAPADPALKVPHMGWNEVIPRAKHPMLAQISAGDHAYFAHSYHFATSTAAHAVATAEYGQTITAAVARDNLFGVQFHPEKSQKTGLQLLRNFLFWRP